MKHYPRLASLCLLALAAPIAAHATEDQKLTASDGVAGDLFGSAVGMDEDTLVVGAPGASSGAGAAYVYVYDGSTWNPQQKIAPALGVAGDAFGSAVAVYGDVIVVGAPGRTDNGSASGAAYVFTRSGMVWTEGPKLLSTSGAAGDHLGSTVDIDGSRIILGAPQNQAGATGNGAAIVFVQDGASWNEEDTLTASDGASLDGFGTSVSIAGDRAAVGAPQGPGNTPDAGAAYTFTRSAAVWSEEAKRFDPTGTNGDDYGAAVTLVGAEVLAVGAPGDDDTGVDTGSGFEYMDAPAWTFRIKRSGLTAGDLYGSSTSGDDITTIFGVPLSDDGGINVGVAHAFTRIPNVVNVFQVYTATDANENDNLGTSVAMSGCWTACGAPQDNELGLDAGATYVFILARSVTIPKNGTNVNPVLMTTQVPPHIGEDWVIEIDATSVPGAAFTQVVAFLGFLGEPIMLPFGQLIVDPRAGFIFSDIVAGSGVNTHTIAIPNTPNLADFLVATQGAVRGSGVGMPILQLVNGEFSLIGCE